MRSRDLVLRSLTYYWRTNVAVVAGVATAVAVLAGALLVGDSVRGSLRDQASQRLGRTDHVVASVDFFREQLADDLRSSEPFRTSFADTAPLVVLPGFARDPASGRRAGQVRVYGVDDRFWQFHGVPVPELADGEVLVNRALADELGADVGSVVLVRVQRPSEIPLESMQGRKDDAGSALRLTVRAIVSAADLGDFSLDTQQSDVRTVFVPLSSLQRELDAPGRVNAILISASADRPDRTATLEELLRRHATLDDLGLTVSVVDGRDVVALDSDAGLLNDVQSRAANDAVRQARMNGQQVFTYLANTLRIGNREVPYSLVTALDLRSIAPSAVVSGNDAPIVLNEWAARELQAAPGDTVTMEYFRWEDPGQLVTRTASFQVAGVVPVSAGDRRLAPAYPGITDSPTVGDWDPPFPVDLRRIRPVDEAYWEEHRTTPKAFIPLEIGQRSGRRDTAPDLRSRRAGGRAVARRGEVDVRSGTARQHRPAGSRSCRARRTGEQHGGVARRHRLRRLLRLLQLLHRRVGAPAGGAVLQARHRAPRARSGTAACRWSWPGGCAPPVPVGRGAAGARAAASWARSVPSRTPVC